MGNVTILFGIAFVTIILVYMFFKLGDNAVRHGKGNTNHFLLQVLLLFFIISAVPLMGKVSLDDKDFCSWNVVNSTTNGYTTSYDYDYQCEPNPNTTSDTFYDLTVWFFRLVASYVVYYFIYEVLKYLNWVGGGKSE